MIAFLIPAAAEAKRYNGDGGKDEASLCDQPQPSLKRRCHIALVPDRGGPRTSEFDRKPVRPRRNRLDLPPRRAHRDIGPAVEARLGPGHRFPRSGKKRQVLSWLIANHSDGGTMTYSDMDHIHVDVGYHFVALNRPSGH